MAFNCQVRLSFPRGFSVKIDAVGVVDKPVQGCVSDRWVRHQGVPVIDGDLGHNQRGFMIVSIFKDFQKISGLFVSQRNQPPVVDDE